MKHQIVFSEKREARNDNKQTIHNNARKRKGLPDVRYTCFEIGDSYNTFQTSLLFVFYAIHQTMVKTQQKMDQN